jgi:hypothetical protein
MLRRLALRLSPVKESAYEITNESSDSAAGGTRTRCGFEDENRMIREQQLAVHNIEANLDPTVCNEVHMWSCRLTSRAQAQPPSGTWK